MTYIKDGTEYLNAQEMQVYRTIQRLNVQRRSTNNSQIANSSGISRTAVGSVTTGLRRRGFIRNVSRGAAYHWRLTAKPALTEQEN